MILRCCDSYYFIVCADRFLSALLWISLSTLVSFLLCLTHIFTVAFSRSERNNWRSTVLSNLLLSSFTQRWFLRFPFFTNVTGMAIGPEATHSARRKASYSRIWREIPLRISRTFVSWALGNMLLLQCHFCDSNCDRMSFLWSSRCIQCCIFLTFSRVFAGFILSLTSVYFCVIWNGLWKLAMWHVRGA